jgi:hypothetical protein
MATCIREVPGSNLGRDNDYPGRDSMAFLRSSRKIWHSALK